MKKSDKKVSTKLVERIANTQVIAYVGAGFSAVCGMPGWSALLARIVQAAEDSTRKVGKGRPNPSLDVLEVVKEALKRDKFAYAASLVRGLLPAGEIRDIVLTSFDRSVASETDQSARKRMARRLKCLFDLRLPGIITTNYDTLIEDYLTTRPDRSFRIAAGSTPELGRILFETNRDIAFFVKIHGSIDRGELVLATEEYDRTYLSSPRVRSFLSAAMLKYSFLFVGASLEDELIRIRRQLILDFDGQVPRSYTITSWSPENEVKARWLDSYANVETIFYDNARGGHSQFDALFSELAAQTAAEIQKKEGVRPGPTIREMMALDLRRRHSAIGDLNKFILDLINQSDEKRIEHTEIGLKVRSALSGPNARLPTIEELTYRVLFLVSIGLLFEKKDAKGRVFYSTKDRT